MAHTIQHERRRISPVTTAAVGLLFAQLLSCSYLDAKSSESQIDFNRDVKTILSNVCFTCHGPDAGQRQSGLRLDTYAGATAAADSGTAAIVPGEPGASELIRRVASSEESERMPPPEAGKALSQDEIRVLTEWIEAGANYDAHWSYVSPERPNLPSMPTTDGNLAQWPRNAIDRFVLARQAVEGLTPSPEAQRSALVRRVTLDLIGLPPTIAQVDQFLTDHRAGAYERLVDRLLDDPAFGEHWARAWLDLARYADSAGYADDPPRTIWAYRDWVIQSMNVSQPFDQFTIEQVAGDLLPNPTRDQLIATAFHRNTMTNNEGGTNDEEFRNVAIVDRVNATMAVWMGTTIDCCQCHDHKYDPLSQEEYFGLFAILNNTEDADLRDERPLIDIWTPRQNNRKAMLSGEIAELRTILNTDTPELAAAQADWANSFPAAVDWFAPEPESFDVDYRIGGDVDANGVVTVESNDDGHVEYKVLIPLSAVARRATVDAELEKNVVRNVHGLQIEALSAEDTGLGMDNRAADDFEVSGLQVVVQSKRKTGVQGKYVRVELPGDSKILSLAEVQVFRDGENLAKSGTASQSSVAYDGVPERAIDGNTDGDFSARSTTHTQSSSGPWWELELDENAKIDQVVLWNRVDNGLHTRLRGARVTIFDASREPVWDGTLDEAPSPSQALEIAEDRVIEIQHWRATSHSDASDLDALFSPEKDGMWRGSVSAETQSRLVLVPSEPIAIEADRSILVKIDFSSSDADRLMERLRILATTDSAVRLRTETPSDIVKTIDTPANERSDAEVLALAAYYRTIAPSLEPTRERLKRLESQLSEMKPSTTVPVMRELAGDKRRTTRMQLRGNFEALGDEVAPGVPTAFHEMSAINPSRMDLAHWLVDKRNPLVARVIANRYWEAIFGRGIVATSEDFGSQGDLPTHPELLDWLATELVRMNWDTKRFLRLLVNSSTYRQTSRVTPDLASRDPDNIFLARGPRLRLSAEMVRDQALFAAGQLSRKMHGPPVKPRQPKMGVNAAFGGAIDWDTSSAEDQYRRGLYTTWRRTNPYPSMAAFDAPSREVCTIRRNETNTPLQALVTLNDPVYVDAARGLADRMMAHAGSPRDRARHGFRICLARLPNDDELSALVSLHKESLRRFEEHPADAVAFSSGQVPDLDNDTTMADPTIIERAAWIVVGNVLLNLDEMLMKR